MTLLITEQDCEKVISIKTAIPAIEDAYRMSGDGNAEEYPRFRLPVKTGKGPQFKTAALHAKQVLGVKISAVLGSSRRLGWTFLYGMETSELLAIVQSRAITKIRTSAATAVAVKYLSPPTASVVGMYGTGRQADAQLEAICAVRPIRAAHIYSRTPEKREAFCRRMSERLGIDVIGMQTPEEVLREAEIIVTLTNSVTPVLFGDWIVRPGLVVGAGATEWFQREIDEKVVEMAQLVVVDKKEPSKVNGGDLLWAVSHGLLRWDQVEELGDIVVGRVPVPDFSSGIILFESYGVAIEDAAIAMRAYELARAQGLGSEISV